MMELFDKIQKDMYAAMKSGDKTKAGALRVTIAALKDKRIAKREDLDEIEQIKVVQTLVKQRRESIEMYTQGGRQDLADKEQAELSYLEAYLPAKMSDEDLKAIISYLRSQEPVKNEVPASEFKFLGKALIAFGALTPIGPKNPPEKSVMQDTTAAYGKYLANSVANCYGCHTDRDLESGAFIGEPFAGGFYMPPEPFTEGYSFVTPNLTPDPETGIIADWDEELFLDRFKSGRIYKGTPMPWGAYSRMPDEDVKALYRYLQTLKPVHKNIEKLVFAPGESM